MRRSSESALAIDVSTKSCALKNGTYAVFVDVRLTNIGNRRVDVPAKLSPAEIDGFENSIRYPGDLMIKRLAEGSEAVFAKWWPEDKSLLRPVLGVRDHVSLLHEYSDRNGDINFFMEPKERYDLGTIWILPPGAYAAKIVIVGVEEFEFWSRIVGFRVPEPDSTDKPLGVEAPNAGDA